MDEWENKPAEALRMLIEPHIAARHDDGRYAPRNKLQRDILHEMMRNPVSVPVERIRRQPQKAAIAEAFQACAGATRRPEPKTGRLARAACLIVALIGIAGTIAAEGNIFGAAASAPLLPLFKAAFGRIV